METVSIPPPMTFEQAMAIIEQKNQAIYDKIEADRLDTLAKIEVEKKLHAEHMQKFEEKMENLSRRFGDLGNRLGDIVEYLVTTNLKEKFDKYGFCFRSTGLKIEIYDGKKTITDIDVLLYDGDCIMAVEVKTRPTTDDVERHILRMEQIQQYPNNSTKGMKTFGAIACAVLNDDVKEAAFSAGFYVITQTDDNINIIPPPDNFVAKFWEVKNV